MVVFVPFGLIRRQSETLQKVRKRSKLRILKSAVGLDHFDGPLRLGFDSVTIPVRNALIRPVTSAQDSYAC